MVRIATALLLTSVCWLLPLSAFGAVQFWVTVGSFTTPDIAEKVGGEASQKLGKSFVAMRVETSKGVYFRVVSGPYTDRDTADDHIRSAHAAGYTGAWIWSAEETIFAPSSEALSELTEQVSGSNEDEFSFEFDELDASIEDLLRDDDYLNDLPPLEPSVQLPAGSDDAHQLIEKAPAGYNLNKLRRDARYGPLPESVPSQSGDPPGVLVTMPARIPIDAANPITLPTYPESQISIQIDGHLDEPQWQSIPGVDSFLVVDPDTEGVPRHQTVVKMFYTEKGLYASFEMEQPPNTLVTRYSGRDEGRLNRDNVGVTIDTSGQGRYGYWVNLALGGNQVDGTVLPERQFSGDWDGAWYGGTVVTATGWNAEIFLPWSQVAMPKEAGIRTINAYVSRKVAYLDERWAVPSLPFTQPLFMSALQPLLIQQVDPRQQWSVFPYASVTQDQVEAITEPRIGADIFWRPSSNFQMTATLNPDFGNVESDDVIVNLSAFETFFPEKRLFFKEGTEVFDATPRASRGNRVTALHTRRIGGRSRAPDVPDDVVVPARELGAPIELAGATKVVGQMGDVRYGILGASEGDAKFDVGDINYHQEGSDYGVARFLYENKGADGSYRAIGSISTLAAHEDQDATVHGLDYHYLTGRGKLKVDGQVLHSDKDDVGQGSGGFVDVRYAQRRGVNYGFGVSHFDDALDINDLGYLRRNNETAYNAFVNYSRSDLNWVRKAEVNAWTDYGVNADGERIRSGVGTNLGFDLTNRDNLRLGVAYFPRRDEDRDSRGNGTFTLEPRSSLSLNYRTDSSKRVSYRVEFGRSGEVVAGDSHRGRLAMTWRPIDRINIGATAKYKERDGWLLWQGGREFSTFTTREWRPSLDLDYFLSAKQQLRLSAQWVGIKAEERNNYLVPVLPGDLLPVNPDGIADDFAISRVNLQLRYRWELAPLSELFVVYTLNGEHNETMLDFADLFQEAYDNPVGEQLVVKLRYRMGS